MNKVAFIIPYFGKFNNYFPLFLKSCEFNKNIDWLIFTDDDTSYTYPVNVQVHYMDFSKIQRLVQEKFDFPVSLKAPYKLCDYKAAYGYLFENYIKDYAFWGFCDCDVIMGNLSKFITEDMLREYDRIFTLGHMSLFRNNFENNRIFRENYEGETYYKKVFQSDENFGFDEMVLNDLFVQAHKKIYEQDVSANVSVYHYKFQLTKRIYDMKRYITEEYVPAVYVWEKGKILRYFISEDDGLFTKNEFAYIHLQQRNMNFHPKVLDSDLIQIMPNQFLSLEKMDIEKEFQNIKKCKWSGKGHLKCLNNFIRWKIKRNLSFLFPGEFTRGNV